MFLAAVHTYKLVSVQHVQNIWAHLERKTNGAIIPAYPKFPGHAFRVVR